MKRPLDVIDGEITSDFSSWTPAVENQFDNHWAEFSREQDKISWLEGILEDTALCWHQARARGITKTWSPRQAATLLASR
jgi:hypothetical protein